MSILLSVITGLAVICMVSITLSLHDIARALIARGVRAGDLSR